MFRHTRLERFGCELFSEATGDVGINCRRSWARPVCQLTRSTKYLPAVNIVEQPSPYRTKRNYGPWSCIEWLTAL